MGTAVGVLVNPIAGFGGPRGLHGTDGLTDDRWHEAVAEGRAAERTLRAVRRLLADARADLELVAPAGVLGGDALTAGGIPHRVVGTPPSAPTTSSDTREALLELRRAGVDALLFAGGDGTALDVAETVGRGLPVVGVPAGVKMHSEVFARSPEGAGRLTAQWAAGDAVLGTAEVLDVVRGDVAPLAVVTAPRGRETLQRAKAVAPPVADRRAVARDVIAAAAQDTTWVVGPGTGAGAVAELLGFEPTLRGVDVRHPSGAVELDVDERRLVEVATTEPDVRLVLGVVGGQGFLLGRGNQQISSRVVDAIGPDAVDVVATAAKVGALQPPVLLVDADPPGAHPLLGYRRVRTGPRQSTVMRVLDAAHIP